ncbi:PH domain-containing protein [Kitasatospora sp. NPDC051853]|uniref:PH domain-containing protein n=1 Tax=Kitasatospora sp. NPDC051853 TaxID=3364058 RepID=UPI0037BC3E28
MEETRIEIGPAGRGRTKRRMAGMVLLFGGVATMAVLRDAGGNGAVVGAAVGVLLLVVLATHVEQGWGSTTLTPAGLVLTSLTGRRTVPWERITRIEVRRRARRYGGSWVEARILLADAAPVRLPGLLEAPGGHTKQEFQDRLGVLLRHWQQATGRTEGVLVRLGPTD